jgi:hypothetical protein
MSGPEEHAVSKSAFSHISSNFVISKGHIMLLVSEIKNRECDFGQGDKECVQNFG